MSGLLGVKGGWKASEGEKERVHLWRVRGVRVRGEGVVREEECNGVAGTVIVAEKAPEILELGRVL